MSGKSVTEKLFIRKNYTVLLLNAPKGYTQSLGPLPEGVKVTTKATKPAEFIQVFAAKKNDMTQLLLKVKPLLKQDGLLWATYPKGGQMDTDLKREVVWECAQAAGMHAVSQISLDEVWSDLRFKLHY